MAQICAKCGKKIGVFSNDYITLSDERILCYPCAEPIKSNLFKISEQKDIGEFEKLKSAILDECTKNYDDPIINDIRKRIDSKFEKLNTEINELQKREQTKSRIENYMLTTGYDFNGYKIKKYLGVISGQVVLGTGFLSEFTASFADFFGEESNRFADKLETAKNAAVDKLIIKSDEKGGNAIIGVDFDYITFHGNMIGVVANGTSVVIEEEK